MKRPLWIVVGVVVALLGLLFTLQGADVIGGSAMSGNTFWTVAGPIIIVIGLVVAVTGARRPRH
jgi:quinol-cytochrome oxidoreductase complex cytochrome b subunit